MEHIDCIFWDPDPDILGVLFHIVPTAYEIIDPM